MALLTQAIRGTGDVLPNDSHRWQFVENTMLETARLFGFREIRTPVFEHTELFVRSVGDTTDVVQKEMYTFDDNGGRSITLRPEGTAGAVRAFLEHGLHNEALPQKVSYVTSCYRYEKPQAGRLREFHQFGVECFGAAEPQADAEIISLAAAAFEALGIKNLSLEINSIGCPECRAKFYDALREYFGSNQGELCETCKGRLERNPMRILDCKSPVCKKIAEGAPTVLDYICDDCRDHFEKTKSYLTAMGIEYTVNPTIVRGLDYYTRTVFEFVSGDLGAQSTVCGGGRYDGLVEQMGGPKTPALGFAVGLERLLMIMDAQKCEFPETKPCDVYIAPMGEKAATMASKLAKMLRAEGFFAETDIVGRGLKAQMKYANKIGAKYTVVLGDDEIAAGKANLKCMETGEQTEVSLPDGLISAVYDLSINASLGQLTDALDNFDFKL
ncbi:MAG: histidine--tRNA ligase [Clostridia bacterium]|nr:histidine--tRNA ligase [Clostridia bacterium]MBQ2387910.1 histidine--tRNA ligase [Clostridia bacterium]MBQ5597524.1 histidine--tRNA ligase [Clostridia bacterium]MBQ5902312.1 histidine--tRNA ligase [Clostridia bacterium]